MNIIDNMEKYNNMTLERCKLFRSMQIWPIANELDYEGWLSNFKEADLYYAELILNFFMFFSKPMIKKLVGTAIGNAGYHLKNIYPSWTNEDFNANCWFSYVPGEELNPTDSGNLFLRYARDLGIPQDNILDFGNLLNSLKNQKGKVVILVDDFVGSGAQCSVAWNRTRLTDGTVLKDIVKANRHTVIYTPLIINDLGRNRILRECSGLFLYPVHYLDEKYDLFSPNCICWLNDNNLYQKGIEMITRKSQEIGIPMYNSNVTTHFRGFGNQGLAIAFEHGAPDAIPAFFYWKDKGWTPLIKKTYKR